MSQNTDILIGQRIKERRIHQGLTQAELASAAGVTFQQIQKYERGVNRVAASRLQDICVALDTPVTYFYAGLPGQVGTDQLPSGLMATSAGRRLVAAVERMDTRQIIATAALAESFHG